MIVGSLWYKPKQLPLMSSPILLIAQFAARRRLKAVTPGGKGGTKRSEEMFPCVLSSRARANASVGL